MGLHYFYQTDLYGNPIPGSNTALVRKPNSLANQRWVPYVPAAWAQPCCPSGALKVNSIHRKWRYYVRISETTSLPISGTLMKHKSKPPTYYWQEVIGKYQCATLAQFNATLTWTGTNPNTINILSLLSGLPTGTTLVENATGIPTDQAHMTVDASTNGTLVIHQNSAGISNTDTLTLHYTNGTCTFAFQVTFAFTHS